MWILSVAVATKSRKKWPQCLAAEFVVVLREEREREKREEFSQRSQLFSPADKHFWITRRSEKCNVIYCVKTSIIIAQIQQPKK